LSAAPAWFIAVFLFFAGDLSLAVGSWFVGIAVFFFVPTAEINRKRFLKKRRRDFLQERPPKPLPAAED